MHDVFISYKSEDALLAHKVRSALEEKGIRCWIADRDISSGDNYARDIPRAIQECKYFVLILTQQAQISPWIYKELDSAISARKVVLPLRVGEFPLNQSMTFLLTGVQYLDATKHLEDGIQLLIRRIQGKQTVFTLRSLIRKLCKLLFWLALAVLAYQYRFWLLEQLTVLLKPYHPEVIEFLTELLQTTDQSAADFGKRLLPMFFS